MTRSIDELKTKDIPHQIARHEGSAHTAIEAAKEIGLTVGQIIKTLAFSGNSTGFVLFLIPGDKKFDRNKIAAFLKDKTVDLLSKEEVLAETGYPVGLVTPFGTKKRCKIYAQDSIPLLKEVGISSGVLKAEIIMKPKDLLRATEAVLGDFCK